MKPNRPGYRRLGIATLLVGALSVGLATAESESTEAVDNATNSTKDDQPEDAPTSPATTGTSPRAAARRVPSSGEAPVTASKLPKADPNTAGTPAAAPAANNAGETKQDLAPAALPTGGDKSGVTGKAISIPKGAGTIEGMGESFSTQLSTGVATFNLPFSLPKARGAAQPSLGLSYSSGSGQGIAGLGWSVGVPFIARQTDRGTPGYDDRADWHAEQDSFVFNGGQELVPICTVRGATCAGAISQRITLPDGSSVDLAEAMPAWADGWQYFRPRVEGSFQRFFWSADHKTWRVQDKSGVTMELGVPLDDPTYWDALERNPQPTNPLSQEIYRWHLVRQFDAQGSSNGATGAAPPNLVVYRYLQSGNTAVLTDIYDTPPAPGAYALSGFAHHTHLTYAQRTDPTATYRSGWKMEQLLRLVGVDVASKTFNGAVADARHMVRRYHLSYSSSWHQSLLESVQIEGRCGDSEDTAPAEGADGVLAFTECPRLPAMTFAYQHVTPYTADGQPGAAGISGYEGFDARLQTMANSPKHSVDEALTDFLDVNSDGLADLLVTAPGMYGGGHGVFFNGASGTRSFGNVEEMGFSGVLNADAATVTLRNLNVAPLDLDGDGFVNLLHMPLAQSYGIYSATRSAGAWRWIGRSVSTATRQDTKIDFTRDALETQILDVNSDGLVDVVVGTGTEIQTFFSLGRYPGGDGQFGHAEMTGAITASLSNDPVKFCVPFAGAAVRFSDAETKTADMNGDGLVDIVKLQRGQIRYWPGRGNGFWGTGDRNDCVAGSSGTERHITMTSSPQFSDVNGDSLRLDDINGDGLADLVQIRADAVDVWTNIDGQGWSDRQLIQGTPPSPSYAGRVRLMDISGSGTPAILWGNSGNYQYMDLTGGKKPGLLVQVANGLGKTTALEYSTSTAEMLSAEAKGACPDSGVPAGADPWAYGWCKKMPQVAQIVRRVTESDNLVAAGQGPSAIVTEYEYRDPVYEGRQREFRGFSRARIRKLGDANSPTDLSESVFLLGECQDENTNDSIDTCSLPERWRDNPMEALKGLPVVTEQRDLSGRTLSTNVTQYELHVLYNGLDGRDVRHAVVADTTSYLYDTSASFSSAGTVTLTVASRRTLVAGTGGVAQASAATPLVFFSVPIRSASHAVIQTHTDTDFFGNAYVSAKLGCTSGCDGGTADEQIATTTLPVQPAENLSGWLWRDGVRWMQGTQHGSNKYHLQYFMWDTQGNLRTTLNRVEGSLPLDRAAIPGNNSPQAVGHSSDGMFVESQPDYDVYGNVTHVVGTNGRCVDTSYDSRYNALPVTETVRHQGCSSAGLVRGASYDRAFEKVTVVVDFNDLQTKVDYDGFGRPVRVYKPSNITPYGLSAAPTTTVEYFLPPTLGLTVSATRMRSQDGADETSGEYLEKWEFVDGFGKQRTTLSEADPSAGDEGNWIVSALATHDAKGAVQRKHVEYFWTGNPSAFAIGGVPSTPYNSQRYDAFGRAAQTFDIDGTMTLKIVHHALSMDMFDTSDLAGGPHTGSYTSQAKDGHGRTVRATERVHQGTTLEARHILTSYSPTNKPEIIRRRRSSDSGSDVVRWVRYDSLDRMVLNVDPHTTVSYTADPQLATPWANYTLPTGMRAWRYQYNDSGDLVGTSDARGCGSDFTYDLAGRLIGEDYFPCASNHQAYSAPDVNRTTGWEVAYFYDAPPAGSSLPPDLAAMNMAKGRLVAVRDRAVETWTDVDNSGRVSLQARRIAAPADANEIVPDNLASRYTNQWFTKRVAYDAADRTVAETTGAQGTAFESSNAGKFSGADDRHVVTTAFSSRGTIRSVAGSYGTLVSSIQRRADGFVNKIVYGDSAQTTTNTTYDHRRRPATIQTYRAGASLWASLGQGVTYSPSPSPAGTPTSFQMLLEDTDISYDEVGNPIELRDWRDPAEWPVGAKPVNKKIEYDDLNRVRRIAYEYASGDDTWVSPYDRENVEGTPVDSRRAKPHPQIQYDKRVLGQSFEYDWLGNLSKSDDDVHGFYDRSLGTVAHGDAVRPYRMTAGTNESLGGTRTGNVAVSYDATGNMTSQGVVRRGVCLPTGYGCTQQYAYDWDEVGRLVRARRWDSTDTSVDLSVIPTANPAVELRHRYDANDNRVIKRAYATDVSQQRHTLYVFESLEVRRTTFAANIYAVDENTQVPYLIGHDMKLARLQYEPVARGVPQVDGLSSNDPGWFGTVGSTLHVLLLLDDYLKSTGTVIDKATGELVEKTSFQPYGSRESDYRPSRWSSFRTDYGFTGKEEDIEVGLTYFGKRFLSPALGIWTAPDPLAVHAPGEADLNGYAYVHGALLKFVDLLGLDVSLFVGTQKTKTPRTTDVENAKKHKVSVAQERSNRAADDKNFANRAQNMKKTVEAKGTTKDSMAVIPETGKQLLMAMEAASEKGPIKNMVVWAHSTPSTVVMREDTGFTKTVYDEQGNRAIDPAGRSGIAYVYELAELKKAGRIKFSEDATIVLAGCKAAGDHSADPYSLAAMLHEATGARVIASAGKSSQAEVAGDLGKEHTMGTWIVFDSDSPQGRPLKGDKACTNATCSTISTEKLLKSDKTD